MAFWPLANLHDKEFQWPMFIKTFYSSVENFSANIAIDFLNAVQTFTLDHF